MEGYTVRLQKLCRTRTKTLVSMMGIMASVLLLYHTFTLSSRIALSTLFPYSIIPVLEEKNSSTDIPSPKSIRVGKLSLLTDSWNATYSTVILEEVDKAEVSDMRGETDHDFRIREMKGDSEKIVANSLSPDGDVDGKILLELEDGIVLKGISDRVMFGQTKTPNNDFMHVQEMFEANSNDCTILTAACKISSSRANKAEIIALSEQQGTEKLPKKRTLMPLQNGSVAVGSSLTGSLIPLVEEKKVKPPVSMSEMNLLLLQNRPSYQSMRPKRYLARDRQMLAVKAQIENAPIVKNDGGLYGPAFRNISMFKRSYELMERTLKIFVYKEGRKPIFHQPLLKGIYASEGWFMKLMETSRQYVVRDPRKAHLFYMPFSSRLLEFTLYVRNSHNQQNLEQYLKNYVDTIAAKYPFWNRTTGADHFLVACHDWAPYETRQAMGHSIRALCNADINEGFQLGKDVSLPETYVRSAQNPLRDLGGMPAEKRPTLAFFAGNIHGRLRPILLQHWEMKDPDMKIFGPMPPGVVSKMVYIQHMKTSKYCICPRGYEVNSPRVVESIFYECIPVIISDNYVPPFFEVLNWEAFSVIIQEKDVPRLKEILESIPEKKYLSLQLGVRRVQQHFLWHSKPVKYDLFHMILHSIWFNRAYQIGIR